MHFIWSQFYFLVDLYSLQAHNELYALKIFKVLWEKCFLEIKKDGLEIKK